MVMMHDEDDIDENDNVHGKGGAIKEIRLSKQ
jgi:hypothetical protein